MDPEQREIIRSSLEQIDLILRQIWLTAREEIQRAEMIQSLVDKTEEHTKPIREVLDDDGKETHG